MEGILKRIASSANDLELFGDEIKLGFCCDDCPGRTTKIVITVGEIRGLAKMYNNAIHADGEKRPVCPRCHRWIHACECPPISTK